MYRKIADGEFACRRLDKKVKESEKEFEKLESLSMMSYKTHTGLEGEMAILNDKIEKLVSQSISINIYTNIFQIVLLYSCSMQRY